ncbi:hypothetical protein HK099_003491, partial [Clydaea vesicula]
MISTSSLCYGIDYPNITTVIKIGVPYDFTGYVQLKGRLVRDPSLNYVGNSIIILNSAVDKNFIKNRLHSLENDGDEEVLLDFLSMLSWIHLFATGKTCLRLAEDFFLNFYGRKDVDVEEFIH